MSKVVKVLIADDHPLMLHGLKQILETQSELDIAQCENGEEALVLIRKEKPQIAILDIEMPKLTGFEVAKQVRNEGLNVDIIFLTMYSDENMFNKAMDIGVKGYVLKENTVLEIIQCIKTVLNGKHYLSPAISAFLVKRNQGFSKASETSSKIQELTPTEKKVLKQVAEMKTSQEIADSLFVSVKTIQNHRNNICNKLGLHGAHALLKFAVEHTSQL